jgi:RNA polymerase sigma-70 factor (ECF subfamily)
MTDTTRIEGATQAEATAAFERLRPYLLRVAYSHLGTLAEAEDVVQEAWLRLVRTERSEIRDLRAWLTTVVSRIALDALTSARARRERYVGPWLPEPVVETDKPSADPLERVELDESVSMALLIVLESLSPAERSAFLLHDVFGYSFNEVAGIVGRTSEATRQLATRARHAVEARRPRYPASPDEQREVVEAFLAATEGGDIATLLELLDPDVTFRSDGGGRVSAARKVFTGAERVARIITAMYANPRKWFRPLPVLVNGAPGLLVDTPDWPTIVSFTVDHGRITEIDFIRNPEKLRTLARITVTGPEPAESDEP